MSAFCGQAPSEQEIVENTLQGLISEILPKPGDDDSELARDRLQLLFVGLARQLGRIEAMARLLGVPRDETLRLFRQTHVEGKREAFEQHQRTDCACVSAAILLQEIEAN
jgi:hypothetical protein